MMYRNVIVIDHTEKDNPVLLLNRSCASREALSNTIDKIIVAATKATSSDEFINNMDTYIELNDIGNNDTTAEISTVYKILIEDYNL
jgi:hypothetical protein